MSWKSWSRLGRAALLFGALGTCSGCATVVNQYGYWSGEEPLDGSPLRDVWWVYGGATSDYLNLLSQRHNSRMLRTFSFYDFPLSAAADTLLLPLAIIQQVVGRPGDEREDAETYRQRFPALVSRTAEIKRTILPVEEPPWVPFQVSFWDAESTHLFDRSGQVRGLRLNLTGGTVHGIQGMGLGIHGLSEYSMNGVQANLIGSKVGGPIRGLQLGGLGSFATEVKGVQLGGFFSAAKFVQGIQVAGLVAGGPIPPDVRGIQISLINDAMTLKGIQIGLINIHRKGWIPVCPLINFGFGGREEEYGQNP